MITPVKLNFSALSFLLDLKEGKGNQNFETIPIREINQTRVYTYCIVSIVQNKRTLSEAPGDWEAVPTGPPTSEKHL